MRIGSPRLGILVAAALALSGCLRASGPLSDAARDAPILPAFVNPIELDHDHTDLAEHQVANAVELVGRDPIGPDGVPPGGVGEIDVQGHYAFVALLGYGFAIIDLSDPTHPKTLSATRIETPDVLHYTADIKVDKTGNWVFVAMELSTTPGLLIYDARDKASPKLAGAWIEPGKFLGCHMIEYAEIAGQEYLFCAPLDAAVYVGLLTPPSPTGQRAVLQVARWAPANAGFVQKRSADPVAGATATAGSGHDDMTFQPDPLTKRPMLYVSFWDLGVRFLDVSVPAAPAEVGAWEGDGAQWYRGQIHTTMSFASEGRRIVVSIPEVADPPAVFVIDATDLAHPKLLSEWRALGSFKDRDGNNQAGTFSTHNFQVVDGKVYLAMYHGGLWVLDVSSPENQADPKPVGSYMPHEPRPDGKPYAVGAWDVVVWNGYLLTGDANGGFYVLHHDGDPAGDPAYASFA